MFIDIHAKESCGLAPNEIGAVGENLSLVAQTWEKSRVVSERTIPEWYAVRVPGTILNPSDADFSAVYATKDRQAAMRLQKP